MVGVGLGQSWGRAPIGLYFRYFDTPFGRKKNCTRTSYFDARQALATAIVRFAKFSGIQGAEFSKEVK